MEATKRTVTRPRVAPPTSGSRALAATAHHPARALISLSLATLLLGCQTNQPSRPPAAVSDDPRAAAAASESLCALCDKPIPPGAEVLLLAADAPPVPYRCIHCALTAQAAAAPATTVRARAPLTNTEITIRRERDGWSVAPSTAVFLSLPEEGGECMDRHRVFADRAEYDRYLVAHPELPRGTAVPYTIDQLADLLASGLPVDGIRPDAPVQLLIVGMVTHLPFQTSVLPAIEGALADAGEEVGARFVDATRTEGQAILAAHAVHEHLPVVMFLNGSSRARVNGREIDLRGFPGATWSREDLAAVLRAEVARTKPARRD